MDTPKREATFNKALKVVPLHPPFIVVGPRDLEVLDVLAVKGADGSPHPALLLAVDERVPTGVRHTFTIVGPGHAVPDYCEKYIGHVLLEDKYLLAVFKDKEDAYDTTTN